MASKKNQKEERENHLTVKIDAGCELLVVVYSPNMFSDVYLIVEIPVTDGKFERIDAHNGTFGDHVK